MNKERIENMGQDEFFNEMEIGIGKGPTSAPNWDPPGYIVILGRDISSALIGCRSAWSV